MTLTGKPELINPGFDQPPYNPCHLLQQWIKDAEELQVNEPRALVLSTVDNQNKPSSRIVLLKEVDEAGCIFGTSEKSKKGLDVQCNSFVASTLYWRETMQQINFAGIARKLSSDLSDTMWYERTVQAQAVAALSHQSAGMQDEIALRNAVINLIQSGKKIERSATWHGYYIEIQEIEFWHGSQDRFHNRLRYNIINGSWFYQKLQP